MNYTRKTTDNQTVRCLQYNPELAQEFVIDFRNFIIKWPIIRVADALGESRKKLANEFLTDFHIFTNKWPTMRITEDILGKYRQYIYKKVKDREGGNQ